MHDQHEHLIIKSLSGSLSFEEELELRNWLAENPENRKKFEDFRKTWELSNPIREIQGIQASQKGETPDRGISREGIPQSRQWSVSLARSSWLLVVAAIAFLVISALVAYLVGTGNQDNTIVQESNDQEINFELPDSSSVWLGNNSSLNYGVAFSGERRKVHLSGEAFFEVKENLEKPFVLETDMAVITALEASFSVNAMEEDSQTTVEVWSGSLSLRFRDLDSRREDGDVMLLPGEKGILDKTERKLAVEKKENPNVLEWKGNKLAFKRASLREVVKTLEDFFSINISVTDPDLLDCSFTATFTEPQLEEVREALKNSLNLSLVRKSEGDDFILEGNVCQKSAVENQL